MAYALTTQGQGTAPYIAVPDWKFNAKAGTTGISKIEIEFEIVAFNGRTATLLNASNSTQNLLWVYPDGRISYRTGANDRIITGVGAVVEGQKYKARIEYNKSINTTYLYLDDVLIGGYVASNSVQFNQINRYSTSTTSSVDMILYSLSMINDSNYSTYSDSFPVETATGTGTEWVSSNGTRSLVVTNFEGAADSWWVSPGGSGAVLVSNLQADSHITANLTTQIALNSELANLSSLNASLDTKVQLSAQFVNESAITAILQTGAVAVANVGAVATMTAVLSTGIRLNSSMLNTSVLTGVLSDTSPALPPQFIPVIVNITPYSNSASVIYTYSGADATGYKGRINGGTPFILSESPAIIVGLLPETAYTLEIAAENAAGLGVWSIASNFTTLAASNNNNELIIRNIVRPYLRPVLKEIKK